MRIQRMEDERRRGTSSDTWGILRFGRPAQGRPQGIVHDRPGREHSPELAFEAVRCDVGSTIIDVRNASTVHLGHEDTCTTVSTAGECCHIRAHGAA